ncbi:MAG: OPT/YSL family transporter [Phycisphaerales bacterium]|nr:OPT/YSL family transporter [Phycisphaerales bacterium]
MSETPSAAPTTTNVDMTGWTTAQRESHWYTKVYQGDTVRQLSLRAVLMGGVIGMLMSVAGLYTTLKIGWAFGVAITACVISYVIWNVFRTASGNRLSQMTILENNCMASTASAAGYSTGATIATAFGALLLLAPGEDSTQIRTWALQPIWIVAAFTLFTGALGVFLAIPMKRQMINQEQLPFPSGIACATTLQSLYSEGREAVLKAYSLVIALICGAIIGFLNTGEGGLKFVDKFFEHVRIRLPEFIPFSSSLAGYRAGNPAGFGFEPSGLLIAAGMIVGMRVSLSMLIGSCILYFGFGPYLSGLDQATAGSGWVTGADGALTFQAAQHSKDIILNIPVAGAGTLRLNQWSLWGGTAVMVFASLASLALQWKTVLRSFGVGKKAASVNDEHSLSPEAEAVARRIEVPNTWFIAGMIPISIGVLIVNWYAFHMNIFLGIIALGMSFVLSMVACRATGETDTNPIGAMGKVMQLLFAVLPGAKGNTTINLMSASTAANSASSSADLLTDLKSGYILGANPRQQFIAQFAGIFFGTIAIVPAWYLLVPTKAALEAFNPPATNMWKAVAEVLASEKGIHSLPDSAKMAIVIGALVGILLPTLEKLFPKARPYLPSAMGLGLAWVVSFSNSFSFFLGAAIALLWAKAHFKSQDKYCIPIASGLVAGESLIKAILAMLATASGLMHWGL